MTWRRKILLLLAGSAGALLLAIAVCPRPSLYGDTGFSAAAVDREGRLLRLALAEDER